MKHKILIHLNVRPRMKKQLSFDIADTFILKLSSILVVQINEVNIQHEILGTAPMRIKKQPANCRTSTHAALRTNTHG